MPALPKKISGKECVKILCNKFGFSLKRQRGSHRLYKHADGRMVTVSFHHLSDSFPPKTLKSMLEIQARWTDEDLRRLGLN